MTTNPPPDARNARIYVATANVAVMDILSSGEQEVTSLITLLVRRICARCPAWVVDGG